MQPFTPPKKGVNKEAIIAMRKKQAAEAASKQSTSSNTTSAKPEDATLARKRDWIKPEDATDRLRLIFDNSSSMIGREIQLAKDGVVEFLKNCTPNSTAVAIHLLNTSYDEYYNEGSSSAIIPTHIKRAEMSADLVLYASEISDDAVQAYGGTPLYQRIEDALNAIPVATRLIAFSDGEPNQCYEKREIMDHAKELKIPIDTVYVSDGSYSDQDAIREMRWIAEQTGGIFLDLSKGDFKSALKYLAPVKRLMLADSSFKSKVERGEVK